jgi:hypothetical protein
VDRDDKELTRSGESNLREDNKSKEFKAQFCSERIPECKQREKISRIDFFLTGG